MVALLKPSDQAYICLHEAGHAAATYLVGGSVEFIELLPQGSTEAGAKARTIRPHGTERTIAVGGFAVEYLLFRQGRLLDERGTMMTEKGFIDSAMNNSSADKISFFGSNLMEADGTWPAAQDREYMNFGVTVVAPQLEPMLDRIQRLAEALQAKTRVERAEIESILRS